MPSRPIHRHDGKGDPRAESHPFPTAVPAAMKSRVDRPSTQAACRTVHLQAEVVKSASDRHVDAPAHDLVQMAVRGSAQKLQATRGTTAASLLALTRLAKMNGT